MFLEKVKGKGKSLYNSMKTDLKSWVYFGVIAVVFLFTRLYKLTEIPSGMHIDEISMGYNVWSLVNFGTDKYNVSFPIYFNNAGSGQSILYVYVTAIIAKMIGYNLWVLRFIAVLFGGILLGYGTKASYEMFGIKSAYITSAIITVMPVFITSERFAFDCNAMISMFAVFLYYTVMLIKTNKKRYAVGVGVGVALCFYSYILAFLELGLLLVVGIVYILVTKKVNFKNVLIAFVVMFTIGIPLFLYIGVVFGLLPEMHIGLVSITDASYRRTSELGWSGLSIKEFLSNLNKLTSYDDYDFIANEKNNVFFSIPFIGVSLSQFIMLIVLGIMIWYVSVQFKKKEFSYDFLLMVSIVSMLVPMFFTSNFAIYRYGAIFVLIAMAISRVFSRLWESGIRIPALILSIVYIVSFGDFISSYYKDYSYKTYFDGDLLTFCEEFDFNAYKDYTIYIDDTTSYNTSLVLLYGMRANPSDVIKSAKNIDFSGMTYKNIVIGIPSTVNKDDKAIFIIRDISKGQDLYSDSSDPSEVYERFANSQITLSTLEELGVSREIKNNYFVYKMN